MKRLMVALVVGTVVLLVGNVMAQGDYSEYRTGNRSDVFKELNLSATGVLHIAGTAFTGTAAQLNALVAGTTSSALAPAYLLVGNATSNAAAVAVSGDITIATNGAVAIGSSKVTSAMIVDLTIVNADVSATAAIAHTKLAAVNPGYVLVGNASSQAVAVAVSGSGTMSTAGVFTVTGLTTNIDVLISGGTTNTLSFTNGILRLVTAL